MPPPDEPSPYREGEPERVPRDRPRRRRRDDEDDAPPDIGDDAAMRMLLPVGRSMWAIAAGYLGLFSLLCFPAPLAVIAGVMAIIDIQKSKGKKHGMGRAVFGLILGVIGSCVLVLGLLSVLLSRR